MIQKHRNFSKIRIFLWRNFWLKIDLRFTDLLDFVTKSLSAEQLLTTTAHCSLAYWTSKWIIFKELKIQTKIVQWISFKPFAIWTSKRSGASFENFQLLFGYLEVKAAKDYSGSAINDLKSLISCLKMLLVLSFYRFQIWTSNAEILP